MQIPLNKYNQLILIFTERKERRGMEIEIEEAEKKRKTRDDRDVKPRDR